MKIMTLKPRMSEKTYALSQEKNVYVFDVPKDANKTTVAHAVKQQFGVKVTDVNITNIKGKSKRTVRRGGRPIAGRQSDVKKAYVVLDSKDSIPVFAAVEEAEKKAEKAAKKEAK
ncbi:MAG: 50S ribosomal protein L23 [Candidatus Saccharibacteria bacterium]|nr:50S ribosomal protein L23 [Candidatus Saccharibacteria bacterium]